ncbi:MAG: hypothetical protein LUB61_00975, partial [Eggerthellaceae bacterium]|nr:hypothetical protein [Eggerthellaceae bacterium]
PNITGDIDLKDIKPLELSPEDYEFGGKLARQIGADLSGDREMEISREEIEESEKKMQQAARVEDWKAKVNSWDEETRIEKTIECLNRKNNQKEILYDLLVFCQAERTEEETEDFLEAHKQFKDGHHSAHKYIFFMQRTGAIEELEYDCDGVLITDEMRDELRELGAPEEEIEDLGAEWHFMTTSAGNEAIKRFDPVIRTKELLAQQKETRHPSYYRLLEYCKEPKSLDEITKFFEGDPGLEIDPNTGIMGMQPSAYIGHLDAAGSLTWVGGWQTTKGGLKILEEANEK